jgi:hypothetical protein
MRSGPSSAIPLSDPLNPDREPAVGEFAQPAAVGELGRLCAKRLQLAPDADRKAEHLADPTDRDRPKSS